MRYKWHEGPFRAAWLVNCLVTARFTILDRNVRLEIGQNELRLSGFVEGFLRRAVTQASFCDWGKKPLWSDALQTAAMTGASTSMARFTSQVGAGSKSQCLHGARDISLRMYPVNYVTSWNVDRGEAHWRSTTHGGVADAVLAQIWSTLPTKCIATSLALFVNWDAVGGLMTWLILFHSCHASLEQLANVDDQYSVAFRWKRPRCEPNWDFQADSVPAHGWRRYARSSERVVRLAARHSASNQHWDGRFDRRILR